MFFHCQYSRISLPGAVSLADSALPRRCGCSRCSCSRLSRLRDAYLADHSAAIRAIEDGEGVPSNYGDGNNPERQGVTHVSGIEANGQYQNEQQARGDGCSFKVPHLTRVIRELRSRDVEASQAADATPDEEY